MDLLEQVGEKIGHMQYLSQIATLKHQVSNGTDGELLQTVLELIFNHVFTPDGKNLLPWFDNSEHLKHLIEVMQYAIEVLDQLSSILGQEPGQGPAALVDSFVNYANIARLWREEKRRTEQRLAEEQRRLAEERWTQHRRRIWNAMEQKKQEWVRSLAEQRVDISHLSTETEVETQVMELIPIVLSIVDQAISHNLTENWWYEAIEQLMLTAVSCQDFVLKRLMMDVEEQIRRTFNSTYLNTNYQAYACYA